MDDRLARKIADAVLYEGYLLYPYRPSALKNRVRWLFGRVFPEAWCAIGGSEVSAMRTECLAIGNARTRLSVRLRFLHIVSCTAARIEGGDEVLCVASAESDIEPPLSPVDVLEVDGRIYQTMQDAVERSTTGEVGLAEIAIRPETLPFAFPASHRRDVLRQADGRVVGRLAREQRAVNGTLEVSAIALGNGTFRIAAEVCNCTPVETNEQAEEAVGLQSAFVSTHLLLEVHGGEFASLRDPPEPLAAAAAECRQVGLWPVPVGPEGSCNQMLAAPIVLDDYPRIAPESPANLFDGTEIDELLTLRLRTLSDREKQEIRSAGGPAAALLDRAETMNEDDLRRLHGALRGCTPPFRPGDRVRLHPRGRADAFDYLLAGRTAVVTSVERDFDDRDYVAVILDDDPGRDLGELGMPGHRFFFRIDDLERLEVGNPNLETRSKVE